MREFLWSSWSPPTHRGSGFALNLALTKSAPFPARTWISSKVNGCLSGRLETDFRCRPLLLCHKIPRQTCRNNGRRGLHHRGSIQMRHSTSSVLIHSSLRTFAAPWARSACGKYTLFGTRNCRSWSQFSFEGRFCVCNIEQPGDSRLFILTRRRVVRGLWIVTGGCQ